MKKYEDFGWGRKVRIRTLEELKQKKCAACEGDGHVYIEKFHRAIICPKCAGVGCISEYVANIRKRN